MAAAASFLLPTTAVACTPQSCGGGPDQGISLTVASINAVEGAQVGPVIATLTDRDTSATAGQYSADINWGDGSRGVAASIVPGSGPGQFLLEATHVYSGAGSYFVGIGVRDPDNFFNRASGFTMAQIGDAPWSVHGFTQALVNPFCAAVAGIADSNRNASSSDYTATINWGDGTTSPGVVISDPLGMQGPATLSIQGVDVCHSYPALGPYTITTTVSDGAEQQVTTGTAWVYAPTDGGTFAIGDGNAAVSTTVAYWGPQWSAANTVSGGPAPDSFKGFVRGRSPICVGTWTAPPGDSSAAPATVPAYTSVLVASSVTKHGDEIAGNSVHVALVHADGTPGSGTVVFMIC